jgi:hypothetical protein
VDVVIFTGADTVASYAAYLHSLAATGVRQQPPLRFYTVSSAGDVVVCLL